MKHRLFSLLLVLALLICLLPARAQASSDKASQIENQITSTFRAAQRSSGMSSFNGWCATLVGWQIYHLGIDAQMHCKDGKDQYDMYKNLNMSTGGYKITCYPSSQYDLRSALNAITKNGTTDAYNIMVGFERTTTEMGKIYGHAVLIHAIIDGQVYFAECYNSSFDGKFWPEGSAISCSIDTFCNSYNAWTVFDGIIYFGVKTYADACEIYPAAMNAMVQTAADVYKEPSDPGLYEAEKTGGTLTPGDIVQVDALLKTPGGNYWYALDADNAYVPADALEFATEDYSDIRIDKLRVPGVLRKGNGHVLQGVISSTSCLLDSVTVSVYDTAEEGSEPVFSGTLQTATDTIDLNTWKLDRYMAFRSLPAGTYQISITVHAFSYRLENNAPVARSKTLEIWRSELQVVSDWAKYATVTFDGNGGTSDIAQTVIKIGSALGDLPTATQNSAELIGWSLDPEGAQPVSPSFVVEGDTTLYAQWEIDYENLFGWQNLNGNLVFYANGAPRPGWISLGDLTFYQNADGSRLTGWQKIEDVWYSFNEIGVLTDMCNDEEELIALGVIAPPEPPESPEPAPQEAPAGLTALHIILIVSGAVVLLGGGIFAAVLLRRKAALEKT